ncbi:MAG: hypothetical protein R3C53_00700 [Pirellulaceae bacterium]
MDLLSQIVGILAGLVAIFTFTTGINSVSQLRKVDYKTQSTLPSLSSPRKPILRRLFLIVPVFVASIAVTAGVGLAGSDRGGIVCLLLIAAALGVFGYNWLGFSRLASLKVYGPLMAMAFTGLGLVLGTISRGEELFGLATGIAIGAGAWFIAALTGPPHLISYASLRSRLPARHPRDNDIESSDEKLVLALAAELNGRLRVTDVALRTEIGLDKAAAILENFAQRNFCRRSSRASGAIDYEFPDLIIAENDSPPEA